MNEIDAGDMDARESAVVAKLCAIEGKIESMERSINNLAKEYVSMTKTIEALFKYVSQNKTPHAAPPAQSHEDAIDIDLPFPITDKEAVEKFEIQLHDSGFYTTVKNVLVKEFGRDKGTGSGRRYVAYALVDKIFSRQFFVNYTWTGLTTPNDEKHAFKPLKSTVNLFREVVHLADSSYDVAENQKFFQSIMNNAKMRAKGSAFPSRKSSSKQRPKNLDYKNSQKKDSAADGETAADGRTADKEAIEPPVKRTKPISPNQTSDTQNK